MGKVGVWCWWRRKGCRWVGISVRERMLVGEERKKERKSRVLKEGRKEKRRKGCENVGCVWE